MNWNIITEADVQPITKRPGDLSATLPTGIGIEPKADTYFECLSKYVPIQIIGAYLTVEGLLKGLLTGESLAMSLLILLLLGVFSTWLFAKRVLGVVRTSQIGMSAFAFFVWVFATGGWFATLKFWAPSWGTIAVIIFAVMVQIVKIGPLPPSPGT